MSKSYHDFACKDINAINALIDAGFIEHSEIIAYHPQT